MSAEFNSEMLVLARESRGYTQTELAPKLEVQQGTLSRIESGAITPADEFLERAAHALDYPLEFFFQSDRVYGFNSTVFFHRKRQSLPDTKLRSLHAQMNITRMRIDRFMRST